MSLYKQPDRMKRTEYGNAVWTKTFRYGIVYKEEHVKGLSVEGISDRFKLAADTKWSTHLMLDF